MIQTFTRSIQLTIGLLCLTCNSYGQVAGIDTDIRISLEEPAASVTYGGISNLRGWAVAPLGIDRVEIFIDGSYAFDVPMGGNRDDVGNAYPEYPESNRSGFSAAFNYKSLSRGLHTMTARAHSSSGMYNESSSIFNTVTFSSEFLNDLDSIDLRSTKSASLINPRAFRFSGVTVEGSLWEVDIEWDKATQGFEIVDISPFQEAPQCADLSGNWGLELASQETVEGVGLRNERNYSYNQSANISQDGCTGVFEGDSPDIPPIPLSIYDDQAYGRISATNIGEQVAESVEALIQEELGYSSDASAEFAYVEVSAQADGNFISGRQKSAAAGSVTVEGLRYTWIYLDNSSFQGTR